MITDYYVIAGYDLTEYKTDKFSDWKWEDESEKYFCYQRKGHIQLFDDPMSGNYLYLGYILANGDEYDFKTTKFDLIDVEIMELKVNNVLRYLQEVGVITEDINISELTYEMIAFKECA